MLIKRPYYVNIIIIIIIIIIMLIKRPYLRSTKQNKVAVFFLYKMKNNYMACLGGGKTD